MGVFNLSSEKWNMQIINTIKTDEFGKIHQSLFCSCKMLINSKLPLLGVLCFFVYI